LIGNTIKKMLGAPSRMCAQSTTVTINDDTILMACAGQRDQGVRTLIDAEGPLHRSARVLDIESRC
jgi:hypothetical protein